MKKLIYSLWVFSFASTSSLVLTTAWKMQNQQIKQKVTSLPTNFNQSKQTSWDNFDLRNFVVPSHHLDMQNQQAIDPNQADLNVNMGDGDVQD